MPRWAAWVGLAGVLLGFGLGSWSYVTPIDDAYISYRYAAHLVSGEGLVFNVGERVEGFTNLLWTLLVAAGVALGGDAPQVGHRLGWLSGLACLGAVYGFAASMMSERHRPLAVVASLVLLTSVALPRWAASGLETPLFCAVVVGALWAHAAGRMGLATGLAFVATLTRPEGVLLAGALFVGRVVGLRETGLRGLAPVAVFAAGLAALTLWRIVYFGDPLPNTFYAKVGGVGLAAGVDYLVTFLRAGAGFLLIPAAAAVWWVPKLRVAGGFALGFSVYVVLVGGDVFGLSRFLLPVLAVLAVLAVVGAAAAFERRPALAGVACLCLGLSLWTPLFGLDLPSLETKRARALADARRFDVEHESRALRQIAVIEAWGAPRLVAHLGIGAFAFHSDFRVLDLLGLTDPVIARAQATGSDRGLPAPGHQRSAPDYVLEQRPDYIIIPRNRGPALLNAVADLWDHPEFQSLYQWNGHLGGYRLRSRYR